MKKVLILALAAIGAIAGAQSFTEGFDTGPTGWLNGAVSNWGNAAGGTDMAFSSGTWHATNITVPLGTLGWFCNPDPVNAVGTHTGPGVANASFEDGSGLADINNFLMSPVRTLKNGDQISFWTRTVDSPFFPDRLIVKMSTSGSSTSTGAFTNTLLTINPNLTVQGYPSVWTQFTITLSGLGGPTSGRFAFNYNVNGGGPSGANSDFIGIDDVAYQAGPEPASMIALGLGAAALLRRRRKVA